MRDKGLIAIISVLSVPSSPSPLTALLTAKDQPDLVARVKRRDPQAMGALYDRYGKPAYALILRILSDPAAAEDVLAETFVTAWNQIGSFKENRTEELGIWIFSLARNQAIERLRGASGESHKLNILETPLLFQTVPQMAGRARHSEQVRLLGRALASLEDGERQTLELAYFGGLAPSEIAQKLSQPQARIRRLISAALEKLSRVIASG